MTQTTTPAARAAARYENRKRFIDVASSWSLVVRPVEGYAYAVLGDWIKSAPTNRPEESAANSKGAL